jgi:hypothetical protein
MSSVCIWFWPLLGMKEKLLVWARLVLTQAKSPLILYTETYAHPSKAHTVHREFVHAFIQRQFREREAGQHTHHHHHHPHSRTHARTYTQTHTHTHKHTHTRACTQTHIHTHTCIPVHTCIHAYTQIADSTRVRGSQGPRAKKVV